MTMNVSESKEAPDLVQRRLQQLLEHLRERLRACSSSCGTIDAKAFQKALSEAVNEGDDLLQSFFRNLGSHKHIELDVGDVVERVKTLTCSSKEEKLHFVFRVFDRDGDNALSFDEVRFALKCAMRGSGMELPEDDLEQKMVLSIFHDDAECDEDKSGGIVVSWKRFHAVVSLHLPLLGSDWALWPLCWFVKREARTMLQRDELQRTANEASAGSTTKQWMRRHRFDVIGGVVFALVVAALFIEAVFRYRDRNWYFRLAKGFGHNLNLFTIFLLLLMSRNLLVWVRLTPLLPLALLLPLLDRATIIHVVVGIFSVVFSLGHTFFHILNFSLTPAFNRWALWEHMLTTKPGYGVLGSQGLTGVVLLLLLLAIAASSLPSVRRRHHELFVATHKLVWIYSILLLVHSAVFWKWALLPLTLFVGDYIYRVFVARRRRLVLLDAVALAGDLVRLRIHCPKKLKFAAGQFFYVRVPCVAPSEWHPFSATSAPHESELTFHIRAMGDWTSRLLHLATNADKEKLVSSRSRSRDGGGDDDVEMSVVPLDNVLSLSTLDLDGPYGSPHCSVLRSRFAVLIAAGIGIAPFSSVLKTLMEMWRQERDNVPEKVHFIWVSRRQRSFEWFRELLQQLDAVARNEDSFLQLHIFLSGADRFEAAAPMLEAAAAAAWRSQQPPKDMVTGLSTKTQLGHPRWTRLMQRVRESFESVDSKEPVKAFYCGPKPLDALVSRYCSLFQFEYHHEIF